MNGRWFKGLWAITGLAALILLIATVTLFRRADQIEESGIVGYVANGGPAVFLRDQPSSSGAVLTILEPGVSVRVTDSTTRGNVDWYQVVTEENAGWLHKSRISFDPPQESYGDDQ